MFSQLCASATNPLEACTEKQPSRKQLLEWLRQGALLEGKVRHATCVNQKNDAQCVHNFQQP
jgi:hypothetical protein